MAFELLGAGQRPVNLAMQSLWLTGRVLPVGAVLRVRHEFSVGGKRKVEAVYCFALPRDAALRRFQLRTGSLVSHSELRPAAEAEKEYERGIEQGSLAALARQYGDGLVNLAVGNIHPGETVVVDLEIVAGVDLRDRGLRFRFPFTLAPSYHKQAIAVSPEPGWGELELPAGQFGDLLLPRWAEDAKALHRVGFDLELDLGAEVEKAGSPSHRIQVERKRVALAAGGDLPDRDLVLDVEAGVGARVLSGGRQISGVIPSTAFGAEETGPRSVVILIDSSGSMFGAPFAQARSAALACLSALQPSDTFGLAMFSEQPTLWKDEIVAATKSNREAAREFLDAWNVAGGTELGPAIRTVAGLIGGSGGEVLLMTDGQVFGSEGVLAVARQAGIRLHTLGIGSASQDRTLSLLARETGGVSRFVTPSERVDQAALELFAATGRPVASGIEAEICGTLTVPPPERVYRGSPAAFMGRLDEGAEPLVGLRWNGGRREYAAADAGAEVEEALRLLEGARRLTDLDCRLEADGTGKESSRLRKALRQLSEEYGLASREMALVAVMERKGDVPGAVPHTVVVPVGLPESMEVQACFSPPVMGPAFSFVRREHCCAKFDQPPPPPDDPVVQLAAMLEDDGGMPGRDLSERIENSLDALEILMAAGRAFRPHAERVAEFLDSLQLSGGLAARFEDLKQEVFDCPDPQKAAEDLMLRMGSPSGSHQ